MPPKRVRSKRAAPNKAAPPPRPSKRARENNLSSSEEADIHEAFSLFAVLDPVHFPGEEDGVVGNSDVKKAFSAVNLTVKNKPELKEILATLDPLDTGCITFGPFLSLCALKLRARDDRDDDGEGDHEELLQAFRLFTGGNVADGRRITIGDLERIAEEIKLEVGKEEMIAMIEEANGARGAGQGVGLEEFGEVMRRAGAL